MGVRARTGTFAVAGLLLGAASAALAPVGVTVASGAGGVCMGIVVDYGSAPPPPSPVVPPALAATGVTVPAGTSDLDTLNSSGHTPGLNDSGLVCSIDNYPANGVQNCLSASNDQAFYYWSYFQGDPYTNTWTYASVGPASHAVSSGDTYVEGWRYQDPGPDNPTAPKPSMSPATAFAAACPGVTPVPATRSGGGGSSGSTTTVPPSPVTTTTTVPLAGGGSGGAGAKAAAAAAAAAKAPAASTAHTAGAAPVTTTTTSRPTGGASVTSSTQASSSDARHGGAAAVHRASDGGGNAALPVVLVGLVALVLGGLAWFRWRRRPAEE